MHRKNIAAVLTSLVMSGTMMSAQAQTVINFDGFTGVITNQFPEAIFSSRPGAANHSLSYGGGHSAPNILCTGVNGVIDCLQPTYIDFTDPVNSLTFWAIEANAVGVTAQFNVYEDGNFSATVDLVSSGGAGNNEFVDLSSFSNVTRLEIVNILNDPANENGIGWDTFSFEVDIDTDGDGLLDDWETNGVPYTDAGGVEQRFMLPGADPMHKDQYVEVDAMTGLGLSNGAVALLVNAFDLSPLGNPDGVDGITLHVFRDESNLTHIPVWQTDGCWPLDFDAKRAMYYGTSVQRGDASSVALLEAKAKAYRYCIVADTSGPDAIGGCGQRPGDNFVIYIGGGGYDDTAQAAVFMHELGHNLDLRHGGGDDINGKPNYPSIMNYVLSYRYDWNAAFWDLDFSSLEPGDFANLNESSLDETVGIGTPGGYYSDYRMPFGVNEMDGGVSVRKVKYVTLDGSQTDFGNVAGTMFQDGSFDTGIAQDLNYAVDPPFGISLPSAPSPGQTLNTYDDWANVGLPLAAAIGDGAPAPSYPTDELTTEARDWINGNFPPPPDTCLADCDGDGVVNTLDFLCFLNLFNASDPGADCDQDGSINTLDFLCFLNAFNSGC